MPRIIAIDYGTKRCGIAVTDELQLTALPLVTIPTRELIPWITNYTNCNNVLELVIGYPYRVNAGDRSILQDVDKFADVCKVQFPNIQIRLFDERFTSKIALQSMICGGLKKSKRQDKALYDKTAACIILEDYLTYKSNCKR